MKTTTNTIIAFIICIAIPLGIGAIGGYATTSAVTTWFTTVAKPSWNPPNWLFAPVWTSLYFLIGLSSYLVWRKWNGTVKSGTAVGIYFLQLALNLLWSFLFFYFHLIGLAAIEIVCLLIVIVINAMVFYKITPWAGYLYIPYLLWVAFASCLNIAIWTLN